MIFMKIVLTNFHEGLWILKFKFHNKNFTIKDDWKKPAETSQFRIIKVSSFKVSNPDSLGVKNKDENKKLPEILKWWSKSAQEWFYDLRRRYRDFRYFPSGLFSRVKNRSLFEHFPKHGSAYDLLCLEFSEYEK